MLIQTARLLIRPIMPGDGSLIFEGIEESFEQFKRWLPWAQKMPTVDMCEETSCNFYNDFLAKKAIHFVIISGEQCIGMCSYNLINWDDCSADIGYWCRVSEQKKGYMTEALQALIEYGFKELGFLRLTITCHTDNQASQRVASKAGFSLEKKGFGLIAGVDGNPTCAKRYVYIND
jgi:ribosomal-protein-serine acetyltransferase